MSDRPLRIAVDARCLNAPHLRGMGKVLFANSGSEANDQAIKLVWYYNNALGRPQKKKIISRWRGYHGVTIGSGSPSTRLAHHSGLAIGYSKAI